MNYEKIIVELLSRIQAIEEKIGISPLSGEVEVLDSAIKTARKNNKLSTSDIKKHITELLESKKKAGGEFVEITCGVLHKELGLKNAVPMVCNAMKACMRQGDAFVFRSPSGYSATLKIRYNLTEKAALPKPAPQNRPEAAPAVLSATRPETSEISATGRAPAPQPEKAPDTGKVKEAAKMPMDSESVWRRIVQYEWAGFYLPDGGEFAYIAGNDYLAIVATNYRLPRADIEKALALYPFKNAVPLQHLRYPSYIYAILTDERIIGR